MQEPNLLHLSVRNKKKEKEKENPSAPFIWFIYSSNSFSGSMREEGMMNNYFPSENETINKILTLIYTLLDKDPRTSTNYGRISSTVPFSI